MAIRSANIQSTDDFKEVLDFFVERGIVRKDADPKLVEIAKIIHKCTYGMVLWRFRLSNRPIHASIFLDELSSDALQILPQILMGYNKTTCLLIRSVLENALRHVYFSDHPVEFQRLNRDRKWYVSTDFLMEYSKSHYDFVLTEQKFDCLSQISSLYSEMSEYVHGRAPRNLQLHDALSSIEFDSELALKLASNVEKCSQAVTFLLAIYHRVEVRSFSLSDRRFLLRLMPAKARQVWTDHE